MPKGGWRLGTGPKPRPRGPALTGGPSREVTPLEYMLFVMNDTTADMARRDRMAIAAAPFCHPRFADTAEVGKKAQARERARKPDANTSLGGLMAERQVSLAN